MENQDKLGGKQRRKKNERRKDIKKKTYITESQMIAKEPHRNIRSIKKISKDREKKERKVNSVRGMMISGLIFRGISLLRRTRKGKETWR